MKTKKGEKREERNYIRIFRKGSERVKRKKNKRRAADKREDETKNEKKKKR